MLKMNIIAVGKLTEPSFRAAADGYLKRMARFYSASVTEVKPEPLPEEPSPGEIARALAKEAERIRAALSPRAAVVALCVEGDTMSSEELTKWIGKKAASGAAEIDFLVGSSHGMDESLKKSADLRLSVSPMTFPHELFRVMLLEQLYRTGEIASGGKYHK